MKPSDLRPGETRETARRFACLDHHRALEPVVVIDNAGVMVPGNLLTGIQRVLAYQHIGALGDKMDAADLAFCARQR